MRTLPLLVVSGLAVTLASPQTASACGGFFCSTSPINQAREVVVYGYEDDGSLTMSVQINYQGNDEDFAWILPLPVPPDAIDVGTDELFTQLVAATEPQFTGTQRTDGTCATPPRCTYPSYGGGGCSFGCGDHAPPAADAATVYSMDGSAAPDAGPGVTVYSNGTVGPYETVVLGATTAAEVMTWLGDNGYDIPGASGPLLEPYAAAGFVFLALRLNANADTSVIRPITLNMATGEACLPIRLTAIATTPDLPIALFFLGDGQARSSNYSYADVELVPDLFSSRTAWDAAVASRVRELGGQAFATDFAGATPRVSLELPSVTDLAAETNPALLVSSLQSAGYSADGILLGLLRRFIVPPSGADEQTYYNCLARGSTRCGDPTLFDPAGLVAAVDAEITQPRAAAQALVERHAYLTRLSTSMRAEDMTVDPVFVRDADLPDVPVTRTATLITQCSDEYYSSAHAPQVLEVGALTYTIRDGVTMTEDEYCRSRGGTADTGGGGGCSSSLAGRTPALAIIFFIGALLFRGLRQRSRG